MCTVTTSTTATTTVIYSITTARGLEQPSGRRRQNPRTGQNAEPANWLPCELHVSSVALEARAGAASCAAQPPCHRAVAANRDQVARKTTPAAWSSPRQTCPAERRLHAGGTRRRASRPARLRQTQNAEWRRPPGMMLSNMGFEPNVCCSPIYPHEPHEPHDPHGHRSPKSLRTIWRRPA